MERIDYAAQPAHDLARQAIRDYCQQLDPLLYLYLQPRGDGSSEPVLRREGTPTDGLELAESEAVPRHFDKNGVRGWLYSRLRRLPIVPVDA